VNILVTGGAGYLGSVLLPKLLARGHRVRVVDVGYFGVGHLKMLRPFIELVREDIRRILTSPGFRRKVVEGCDCVIHLAAVSNDPSAEMNPRVTEEVNFRVTCALAEAARRRRIRFLFSSSCSLYGKSDGEVDEEGRVDPLTVYAVSKLKAEKAIVSLARSHWRPVILRNGTLFGCSPKMRFDLVVNTFSLYSTIFNKIRLFGRGDQWRPFLHVGDCARAFVYFSERRESPHLCYNIAHENLRVSDLAALFKRLNPRLKVTRSESSDKDQRDYRVSTERMREAGFQTRVDVALGAEEMIDAITSGSIADPESVYYQNSKWLKELMQARSKNEQEIIELMETFSRIHPAGSP